MRFLRSLKLLLNESADGTGKIFFDDADQLARTETADTFVKNHNVGAMTISPNAVEALPFGDVSAAGALLIETDRPLDLVFNGGAQTLRLEAPPGVGATSPAQKGVLYWEGNFSSVQVTNADGSNAASVLYAVIGV